MTPTIDPVPDDIEALRAALLHERAALAAEQLAGREAEARASGAEAMAAHLKLLIAQLKHDRFGASSERGRKLLDQVEPQLEELEAAAAEDEAALDPDTEGLPPRRTLRGKPVRGPLPAHLPRERVVIPGPPECPCRKGRRAKLGEDVTGEAAKRMNREVVPRQWKVVRTVRERFTCRACESVTQPPAPFHPIARGRAGAELLAMVLEAKFGQRLPLNRQGETYAREGVEIDASTMADWVGARMATLAPLTALIEAHVMAAERVHGDDTTVPVLAKGKTVTARLWTYVRDDQPFGAPEPPAAVFCYSRDRGGEHPRKHLAGEAGILQADACAGFNDLLHEARKPGPVTEAGRPVSFADVTPWDRFAMAHGRRKLFDLAKVARAPLAAEAVRRIDALFDVERSPNGLPAEQRLVLRRTHVAPLVADLETWMRAACAKMSRHAEVAKAMDCMLKRWGTFSRFLGDGRICLTNNAAQRALRGVALGRKARLFCGSDRGGDRVAAMRSLVVTAKLNDVDPRAWLADVLRRIADHPASRLHELLPWNWARERERRNLAA